MDSRFTYCVASWLGRVFEVYKNLTRHSVFSLTMVISTCRPGVPGTDLTGLILAYKSISFRSCTIGEEYPATLWVGEETAPNIAHVHSLLSFSKVSGGRATPVFWNCSNPASNSTKLGLGIPGVTDRIFWAAWLLCSKYYLSKALGSLLAVLGDRFHLLESFLSEGSRRNNVDWELSKNLGDVLAGPSVAPFFGLCFCVIRQKMIIFPPCGLPLLARSTVSYEVKFKLVNEELIFFRQKFLVRPGKVRCERHLQCFK